MIVHGLGATPGEARIPASGLRGTRVVVTLPGHGDAADAAGGYWRYAAVAEDVLAVADEVAATRAVGVSLGAGALLRVAADNPGRFERLALLLPASLDQVRDSGSAAVLEQLAQDVEQASEDGGAALRRRLRDGLPEATDIGDYVEQRAATLLRLREALRSVPSHSPLADRAVLANVGSDVLVVGATRDELHPAPVAEDVAGALPRTKLELLDSSAPMLTHRRELRGLLTGFLT